MELFSLENLAKLVALVLAIPVIVVLILAPLRLYAMDRHLRLILEEIKRLNAELRRREKPSQPATGAAPAASEWVEQFHSATEKAQKSLEEKLGKIS